MISWENLEKKTKVGNSPRWIAHIKRIKIKLLDSVHREQKVSPKNIVLPWENDNDEAY